MLLCRVDWTFKVYLNVYDAPILTELYNDIIHLSECIPSEGHFDARLSPFSHIQ